MLTLIILFVVLTQVCANDDSLVRLKNKIIKQLQYFNRNVKNVETFLNEDDFIRARAIPQSRFKGAIASSAEYISGKFEGNHINIITNNTTVTINCWLTIHNY